MTFENLNECRHTPIQAAEQRTQNTALLRRTHQQCKTGPFRTRRATIAVNIRVSRSRYLVVHDVINFGNIKTTRCNVSRE